MTRLFLIFLISIAIGLAGCNGQQDSITITPTISDQIEPQTPISELITVQGYVDEIDLTGMDVDGFGLVHIISAPDAAAFKLKIAACRGPCSQIANETLRVLQIGIEVEARGQVDTDGSISIFDNDNHYVRILPDDIDYTGGTYYIWDRWGEKSKYFNAIVLNPIGHTYVSFVRKPEVLYLELSSRDDYPSIPNLYVSAIRVDTGTIQIDLLGTTIGPYLSLGKARSDIPIPEPSGEMFLQLKNDDTLDSYNIQFVEGGFKYVPNEASFTSIWDEHDGDSGDGYFEWID